MEDIFGRNKEKFLKNNFEIDDCFKKNLKKELSGVVDMVSLPLHRGGLTDYDFKNAIEPIRELAEKQNYSMEIMCNFPNEARINSGLLMNQRKYYHLIFRKKEKNE